jgi:hypothetical protein
MQENPYKNLYKRLVTPFADEDTNPQSKKTRMRFLELFMGVVESNPMMDFSALNFFSLQELNVCKVLIDSTYKTEFLPYFTKKRFLKDKKPIDYFIRKITQRGEHVRLPRNSFGNQFRRIKTAVLLKLEAIKRMRTRRDGFDRYYIYRAYLKCTGLGKYFKWTQMIGRKFSNRAEKDFSQLYCLTLVQGDDPEARIKFSTD